ncbi:MAG: methyltransferase domain-containing protein [Vicinamibacterales bacterium]
MKDGDGRPPGRPSSAAQDGEFESARHWVNTAYAPDTERNPIYDRLFTPRAIDWAAARVLDVGAGPVSIFEDTAPAWARIVAYDTLASRYNRLLPDKKFPIVDRIPPGSFSLISVLNCLDHMDAPAELLETLVPRLAPGGTVWIYCNVDQPFDPTLHPQDFRFWDLVLLISRYFDMRRCGLVREGPLFPYGWWAVCGPRRRGTVARAVVAAGFILACGIQYAAFYAARAVVKGIKLAGGRRLLPKPLRF